MAAETRFRHCAGIATQKPQELRGGMGTYKFGEPVPWSAEFSRRVFDAEWLGVEDEPRQITATIDDVDGSVVGFVQFVHTTNHVNVTWLPEAPEVAAELILGLFLIHKEGAADHPEALRQHVGYSDGEVDANQGRLRLTHVRYRVVNADGSVEMANWIIGGDCAARKKSTWWDASRTDRTSELTDYEDVYGLVSEDLWFDYPEFDRYDDLIFRDAPVLEKLGVPAEIRLKPVPPMPDEVSG